jgi:protein-S-isoprenylcysteine O-methyltransferase Ste14
MLPYLEIVGTAWLVFWLSWLVYAIRTRTKTERRTSPGYQSGFLVLIIAALAILLSHQNGEGLLFIRFVPDTLLTGTAGVLLVICGLLFAVWARVHLGKFWSMAPAIRVDHQLIRTGPYRYVRNPIYTGILVGVIGTAVVAGIWIAIIAAVIMLAGFLLKIHAEEKILMEQFGDEYVRYKQEVKSLIPWVI